MTRCSVLLYNPFDQTSHTTAGPRGSGCHPYVTNDVRRPLTFTYIAHKAPLQRVGVDPSTLFDGFIDSASVQTGRLDDKSRLLEEHLKRAFRFVSPEKPRQQLDRKPRTKRGHTSNNRSPCAHQIHNQTVIGGERYRDGLVRAT